MHGCIILGADSFPETDFAPHKAFGRSKEKMREYLVSNYGLAVAPQNCPDMFDSGETAIEQSKKIIKLVRQLKALNSDSITELLIYYIGHGTTNSKTDDLLWVVKASNSEVGTQTFMGTSKNCT